MFCFRILYGDIFWNDISNFDLFFFFLLFFFFVFLSAQFSEINLVSVFWFFFSLGAVFGGAGCHV